METHKMATKKNKMGPEMMKRLAGLMPARSSFTVEFTPSEYDVLDVEIRPIFTLKPWPNKEIKEIAAHYSANAEDEDYLISRIKTNIIGWKNIIDMSSMEEIEYSDAERDTILDILPQKVKTSIALELMRISGIN